MKFLSSARERVLAVTGNMLKSLAERQAQKAGLVGFKASDGWLGKVKARHGISGKKSIWRDWIRERPHSKELARRASRDSV